MFRNTRQEKQRDASQQSEVSDRTNRHTLRDCQKYRITKHGTRFMSNRSTRQAGTRFSTIRKAETRKVKCASHQPGTLVYELQIRMAGNAERTTMQNETRRLDFSTVMVRNSHVLLGQFEEHEV